LIAPALRPVVGFEVAGILGGLFAVPIAGVLRVFAVAIYQAVMRAAGEWLGDDDPEAQISLDSTASQSSTSASIR
jgi:hypothetical protein